MTTATHTHTISPQSVIRNLTEQVTQTHACTLQNRNGMGSAQPSLVTLMSNVSAWDMQTDMVIYIQGWKDGRCGAHEMPLINGTVGRSSVA